LLEFFQVFQPCGVFEGGHRMSSSRKLGKSFGICTGT
jgi:hypothetical protein